MKKFLNLLVVLGLCAWVGLVQAQDLYAAEVKVQDDSAAQRNVGLTAALREVMVRLSGSTQVAGSPGAGDLLRQAASLVQQYRYRLEELPAAEGQETPDSQRYLWAKFDKAALDRRLRAAGIPVWGSRRPRVLMWLAYERGGQRGLLNLEQDMGARARLLARAADRGMPLQLPLMDLEDQSALSAADVWADYQQALEQASQRYPHDVILAGRLRRVGDGRWNVQWSLWDKGENQQWSLSGQGWYAALLSGIDRGQDLLASRYAPAGGSDGPERVRVLFTQVGSLQAYGRLMQILGSIEGITDVQLREVSAEQVLADVWVRGGQSSLSRMLSLGGELFLQADDVPLPTPQGTVPVAPSADMTFSYLQPAA